ncbi:hypothetical protein LCGC14_0273200 [marine sediment metagenome]|uniref:Uncharacterized protein n=2 Tax=root TaxID=1 RepID=A0A9C9NGQ7_9HYPH|nr:hypothetical protein [Aurantimonas coralicida]
MSNTNTNTNTAHVFETAGLGASPFRFVGFEDSAAKVNTEDGMVRTTVDGLDIFTKPGGSCDYCGTYIVQFCWIKSADGKRFKVGTSCVSKTGDKGLVDRAKRAAGRVRRAKAKAKQVIRIDAARAAFIADTDGVRTFLADVASPTEWRAEKGETWASYVAWMLVDGGASSYSRGPSAPEWLTDGTLIPGAGHTGQFEMTKLIERVAKGTQDTPIWAWQKESK